MSDKKNKHNYKKGVLSPLGEAMNEILPELMVRNIKLGKRLKKKLKVCSLLNNIELRNQNYLKELLSSSDKTLQDLKSGLSLSKAVRIGFNKLSELNSKILNDCFMKKNNIISNTKKDIQKSTEEESNLIISKSLHILKESICPKINPKLVPKIDVPPKKFLSETELAHAKSIVNNKITADEKIINKRIKSYLDKVKAIKIPVSRNNELVYDYRTQIKLNRERNKAFYNFENFFSLNNSDINMIHYQKIKPAPIRDKSCPSLENIKEKLFPEIKTGKIDKENYVNINNSNGVKIINGMKLYKKINKKKLVPKTENNNIINSDIIIDNNNDSFNTLKKLIIRNRALINKTNKNYNKLSSLMDYNLPQICEYETIIINDIRKNLPKNKIINNNKDNKKEINENETNVNKKEIKHRFFNSELSVEFKMLQEEIKKWKGKKLDVEENYLKHLEKMNLMNIFKNMNESKNKRKNSSKKDYLIDKRGFINKDFLMPAPNPMLRMPSSHSVSVLKRKVSGNNLFELNFGRPNRQGRNYSNNTRDKTNASSIKNSISSIITCQSENRFKDLFNNINKKNVSGTSMDNYPSLLYPNRNIKDYPISNNISNISEN